MDRPVTIRTYWIREAVASRKQIAELRAMTARHEQYHHLGGGGMQQKASRPGRTPTQAEPMEETKVHAPTAAMLISRGVMRIPTLAGDRHSRGRRHHGGSGRSRSRDLVIGTRRVRPERRIKHKVAGAAGGLPQGRPVGYGREVRPAGLARSIRRRLSRIGAGSAPGEAIARPRSLPVAGGAAVAGRARAGRAARSTCNGPPRSG